MKLRFFIPLVILFFIVATVCIYGFTKYIQPKFKADSSVTGGQPISKDEKIATCKEGDLACTARNEKIKMNQLEGTSVSFAKHQCDGPRGCTEPKPEIDNAAMKAIRTLAKDSSLELIRMTGITQRDSIYYCASGDRCWTYDTKTQRITPLEKEN